MLFRSGHKGSGGGEGIENISSDEETVTVRDPRRASLTKTTVDVLSPVSMSPPPPSPKAPAANHTSLAFSFQRFGDPSLGLQTLLSSKGASTTRSEAAPASPPCQAVSPSPMAYEPEVEDISGDDSPVMVYNTPYDLQVESVSDDDEGTAHGGGDDMEVCSEDEDNVIELNVAPTGHKIGRASCRERV